MTAALIILAALVAAGLPLWLLDRRSRVSHKDEPAEPEPQAPAECCGMHITCEKDSLFAAVSKDIEYYDDEELDTYAGTPADGYSDEAVEEFRSVLLTLLPDDIAGWARSIQLRGITLPAPVREELLMIVREQRELRGVS